MMPSFLLGQNSIVTYHDQLDGELIAYILQARHLFRGDTLPEFMNGASKTALTVPAPFFVLFFLGGNAYWALTAMAVVERVCGFLGMYLLVREFVKEKWIAAGTGILYGILPFLTVYGMSQFGISLLVWYMLQLRKGKHRWAAWCYAAFYALSSSLVLAGFGILGMGLLWILETGCRSEKAFGGMAFNAGNLYCGKLPASGTASGAWRGIRVAQIGLCAQCRFLLEGIFAKSS